MEDDPREDGFRFGAVTGLQGLGRARKLGVEVGRGAAADVRPGGHGSAEQDDRET